MSTARLKPAPDECGIEQFRNFLSWIFGTAEFNKEYWTLLKIKLI